MTESQDGPYFLARRVLGKPFRLPISEERFEALKQAWANLKHLAHIEEEWDAVVQNYVELEKSLLDAALRDMLISDKDYFLFQESRLRFGVRLSNLLSSCKAYLDHTPHHLGLLVPQRNYGAEFKTLAKAEYDRRFGYRLIEALRAYSQHRGLPVHGSRYDSAWVEGGDEGMLRFSVSTHIDLDILRKDQKFRGTVIKDVTEQKLEAEPHVRDYLEGLSAVHVATRKLIDEPLATAKKAVADAIAEFAAASADESVVGLNAIKLEPPHTWVQQVPLFEELGQLTERLRRRNRPMVNLRRRFVTSAIEPTTQRRG